MKLSYLGHACFKIESADGSIIFDPYKDGSVDGFKPLRESADSVLCSHQHADHSGIECVELTGDDYTGNISSIGCFHDDVMGQKRGINTIYIVETEGVRIAHFGDLGHDLTPEMKTALANINIALIPVGGFFTIDAKQAANIVNTIKPKLAIPMHYRGEKFGYDVLGTVTEFTDCFEDVTYENDSFEYEDQSGVLVMTSDEHLL